MAARYALRTDEEATDAKFPQYLHSKMSQEGVVDTRKARTPHNQAFIAGKRQQISAALRQRARAGDDNLHNWFHEEKDARKKCEDSLELVGPAVRDVGHNDRNPAALPTEEAMP